MIIRSEVEHVAKLAHIELSESELTKITTELSDILSYVNTLNQVDTSNITPPTHPLPLKNVLRTDTVEKSLDPDIILGQAPDHTDHYFTTPKILGE